MNALSSLWSKFAHSKGYRESFAGSVVKRMIPLQIRVLRRQRDWSQTQLAKESNLTQGVISRAEDPDYGNLTINTLVRIAAGFDCAFIARFVPFSELGRWYAEISDEATLKVASFAEDQLAEDQVVAETFQTTARVALANKSMWPVSRRVVDARVFHTANLSASPVSVIFRKGPHVECQTSHHLLGPITTTPVADQPPIVAEAS